MTKSERLRRLRRMAADMRTRDGLPATAKAEIGTRTIPVVSLDGPPVEYLAPGEDLYDTYSLTDAAGMDDTAPGTVVHVYVYERMDGWWDLVDVQCAWMGTDDMPAVMLYRDGSRVTL